MGLVNGQREGGGAGGESGGVGGGADGESGAVGGGADGERGLQRFGPRPDEKQSNALLILITEMILIRGMADPL